MEATRAEVAAWPPAGKASLGGPCSASGSEALSLGWRLPIYWTCARPGSRTADLQEVSGPSHLVGGGLGVPRSCGPCVVEDSPLLVPGPGSLLQTRPCSPSGELHPLRMEGEASKLLVIWGRQRGVCGFREPPSQCPPWEALPAGVCLGLSWAWGGCGQVLGTSHGLPAFPGASM